MDSKKPEYEAEDTTLHVSGKKKEWLEKKAYKLSMDTKKIYTWRDLTTTMERLHSWTNGMSPFDFEKSQIKVSAFA